MSVAEENAAITQSWVLSLHAKRPRTVVFYREELARFARWLAENDRPESKPGDLLAVSKDDARTWVNAQQALGLSGWTVRSRWITLRSFYGWLVDEDELAVSPFAKVVVGKPDTPAPNVLGDEDTRALLRACEGRDFLDRRDLALIRFMLATGLRLSEVVAVKVEDVDLTRRVAYVHDGKGGKYRVARFDAATASAIDKYRRARAKHRLARLPELWLTHQGRLSRKGLPTILDKRARLAGLDHKVHPHQLRHSWAHRLKRGGMGDENLRELGGWESADVMRRYGQALAADRALSAYDDADPMAGL